jgi:uncharacterized membrane protein YphA (DoxX/SURF4 family)/thiol-disulfide isomerase/thioredoxin
MDTAILLTRVFLSVVFATAAVSKLLDMTGTRRAAEEFGVPASLSAMVARALPAVEIAAAVLVLVQPTARIGALAMLVLLLVFVIAIARLLRRGLAPECHCFGQLQSAVAGRSTLLRNLALCVGSAMAFAYGPGLSLAGLTAAVLALLVTTTSTVILALLALALWRENRVLRERQEEPATVIRGPLPGSPAPDLHFVDLHGSAVALRDLLEPGKPTVLVQIGLGCGPCHALMPELVRWRSTLAEEIRIVLASSGPLEPNRLFADEFDVPEMFVSPGQELAVALDIPETPSAVHIDAGGLIGGPPAIGGVAIEALVRGVLHGGDRTGQSELARTGA